ncbi:MAG: hypothetical protein E6K59_01935 [Nitrospirae bacterium]|nr:MAG: hypothetical protein E6K59_01935 [Nitrospirota bacterium]
MNRWDHLDVVVTVGICATILGAGIFFFAFGGAPAGITERFVEPAPAFIDQEGVAQTALGRAIVEAQTLRYMEDVPFGLTQTRLGNEIVAATRTSEARAALMPYLQDEARESLMRMQGMIQETAGRAVVAATQRMWRAGMTDIAQLDFLERLGQIRAAMMLEEMAAIPRREVALGWTVVGRLLMIEQLSGHTQERLGSAVRDAGVLSAMVELETPLAQESLGSAILVASAAQSAVSTGNVPSIPVASTPGVAGIQALREIPYPAGALLFAAVFMIVWGVRCVAESGPPIPTYGTSDTAQEPYRKAG